MTQNGTADDTGDAARRLAEQGLRAQQAGAVEQAERDLGRALQLDPDAVAELLHETGADTAADARDADADRVATPPDASRQAAKG